MPYLNPKKILWPSRPRLRLRRHLEKSKKQRLKKKRIIKFHRLFRFPDCWRREAVLFSLYPKLSIKKRKNHYRLLKKHQQEKYLKQLSYSTIYTDEC